MKGSHAKEWQNAMEAEFNALEGSEACILVPRHKYKKVMRCRWVLRTKYSADGEVERHKARLVAKGYTQRSGIDFQGTFSPVARQSSIRSIMTHAAEFGLTLYQLDVIMAYINGYLDKEIYMK